MSTILKRATQGDSVSLAQALVATPSVNPELEKTGLGEQAAAFLVAGWLEQWGASVEVSEPAPGRFNVLSYIGDKNSGKTLLLNGHLDTVGVEGMTIDPFKANVANGRLMGRGSSDMKGGVASILAVASSLTKRKPEKGALCIALTADEEHASLGMRSLLKNGLSADAAVVCEPTGLAIMPAHKGFVWVELLFKGNAAHGSRADIGVDAIAHAGQYLFRLDELRKELESRRPHPLLGYGSFHAGTITGGSVPSIYPSSCSLSLERRTLPGEETISVINEFQSILYAMEQETPKINASLREILVRSATEVEPGSDLVKGLKKSCQNLQLDAPIEGMTAWVEASYLNESGIPAVCFGPGSIGQAHSDDEWSNIQEIKDCTSALELFVRDFLAKKD